MKFLSICSFNEDETMYGKVDLKTKFSNEVVEDFTRGEPDLDLEAAIAEMIRQSLIKSVEILSKEDLMMLIEGNV